MAARGAEHARRLGSDYCEKVQSWGLLSWSTRWLAFDGKVVQLQKKDKNLHTYKCGKPTGPAFELADSATRVIIDSKNERRISLDNGSALIHIKFEDTEARGKFMELTAGAGGGGGGGGGGPGGAKVFKLDKSRYPKEMGDYWLGPINPHEPDPCGGFGSVMAGINHKTGERICCKMSTSEYEGTEAQRLEVVMHAGLSHVNVVDLRDIVYEPSGGRGPGRIRMIMELMGGGELFAEVIDRGGLGEDMAKDYFRQLLMGMAYCHSRDLVHRDIKLENLLLDDARETLKIADFGLAKDISETAASTVIGTAKYVAPEMLEGRSYDGKKSDIWSCGVCLYCMTECRFPFVCAGNDGVGAHGQHTTTQKNLKLMKDLKSATYRLKNERSPEYAAFLAKLLCVNPVARYSAAEALLDPWMLDGEFTAEKISATIAEMGTDKLSIPKGIKPEDWTAKVKGICSRKAAEDSAAPEPDEDVISDEEDGF